jgi:hypothetical protein
MWEQVRRATTSQLCAQKSDCNDHRDPINEANCSSTAGFVDGTMGRKACVPPNG